MSYCHGTTIGGIRCSGSESRIWQKNGSTVGVLPDVEPTLNWVRLAQRFPVRVRLEPPDPDRPYRMGNTAVVTIKGFAGESAKEDAL